MTKPTRWDQALIDEYISLRWWSDDTWYDVYRRNAEKWPNREAFVDHNRRVNWAELLKMADRVALHILELELKKDDAVIVQLPNCIENIATRIGLERAGLLYIYAAMNVRELELESFIRDTNAKVVITLSTWRRFSYFQLYKSIQKKMPSLKHIILIGDEVPEDILSFEAFIQDEIEKNYPDDYLENCSATAYEVSQVMATSGSTGMPKLCEVAACNSQRHGMHYVWRWKINAEDIAINTAFLWTGPSMSGCYAAPLVGAKQILVWSFDAEECLKLIEKERATYFTGFPVHLIEMANHPNFSKYDVSSLRFISQGGAPFPAGVATEIEEKFGAPLLSYYGTLDCLMTLAVDLDAPPEVRFSCQGKAAPWDEVKLLDDYGNEVSSGDVGIVTWRGASGGSGYFQNPEKTREAWGTLGKNGWFTTGDLARKDKYGNIMLVGRKKDMILRGGQNIYPLEIEGLLNAHPKVAYVQIVPMPDPKLGEKACACIIPRDGQTLSFKEIIDFLMGYDLAKYKLPERLELMKEFPMLGDKVDKMQLGTIVAEKLFQEGVVSQKMVNQFRKEGKIK